MAQIGHTIGEPFFLKIGLGDRRSQIVLGISEFHRPLEIGARRRPIFVLVGELSGLKVVSRLTFCRNLAALEHHVETLAPQSRITQLATGGVNETASHISVVVVFDGCNYSGKRGLYRLDISILVELLHRIIGRHEALRILRLGGLIVVLLFLLRGGGCFQRGHGQHAAHAQRERQSESGRTLGKNGKSHKFAPKSGR